MADYRSLEPYELSNKDRHAWMLSTIGPRPIAWASTINEQGQVNLAPFSFFNVFGSNPPILVFSPSSRVRDNTLKHTLENARATREVVINICSYRLKNQMAITSAEFEQGVNEFIKAGLKEMPSVKVKPPRVKGAPAQYECRVKDIITLGNEGGAGNLIICEVVYMHLLDDIFAEDGHIDPRRVDPIARMGYDWYSRAQNGLFEMPNPKATPDMGVDQLPEYIRQSRYLTDSEQAQLAKNPYRPSESELEMVRTSTGMQEIRERYQNEDEFRSKVEVLAKELINENKIEEAWKVLLAFPA